MTLAGISWKKWALRSVGVLLLILIVWKIGRRALLSELASANWWLVAVSAILCAAHLALKAVRWHYILRRAGVRAGRWEAVRTYYAACLLGMVTPGRIGEVSKAIMVRHWDPGASWGTALGSVVLDRLLDIGVFALVAGWGLLRIGLPGDYRVAGEVAVGLLLLVGFAVAVLVWRRLVQTDVAQRARVFLQSKLGPSVGDFYRVMKQPFHPSFAPAALLTIGAYLLFFTFFFTLARALGSSLSFGVLGWGISLASLAAILPISISGIGTRDFVLLAVFQSWGEAPAQVLAISLTYLGIVYVTILALGIWPFLTGRFDRSVLKSAAEKRQGMDQGDEAAARR